MFEYECPGERLSVTAVPVGGSKGETMTVWPRAEPRSAGVHAPQIAIELPLERVRTWTLIAVWWAASRAIVFGTAFGAQLLRWPRPSWYDAHEQPLALLGAWDGRWYRMIATRGYLAVPHHQSDTAFFPLLPLLLRAGRQLGVPFDVTGLVVANGCLLVALIALYELNRYWLDDATALRAAIYASLFPIGFVFSMVYPEAIVLAAFALACLFAVRRKWTAAAVAAVIAGLGRPEAFFLVLPLGALAFHDWRRVGAMERFRALTAALAAPAAIAGVSIYQWRLFHDPVAFASAQKEWGRATSADGLQRAVVELAHSLGTRNQWLFRDAVFCVVYLVLLVVALKHNVPRSWIVAGALMVVLPLWSGSFTSDARFGLLAIPIYSGLACLTQRRVFDVGARLVCAFGLFAATATILLRWP
jgi:hypothetical protein